MKLAIKIILSALLFILTGCGSIAFISDKEAMDKTRQDMEHRSEMNHAYTGEPRCQECFIIPKSGANRDLRLGYYYDQELGKCIEITFSTGSGCIPAPFKSLDECISCCGLSK